MLVHNKQERTIACMFNLTNTALHIYGAYHIHGGSKR